MPEMNVNVWGYLDEYDSERDEILSAVDRVFRSGTLIQGESVASFESEFARYCGVAHAVGLDNGTNAISLALLAAGIKSGDEVITVPNTAAPTAVAIDAIGARVRFVDIDPQTLLMNPAQLESAVTDWTTAVVPVHLYGQCADMDAIRAVAEKRGLAVFEDCAQAHGAKCGENFAGTMSQAGTFSFYPTKVLGAYGDGGMAITSDASIDANLRRLRHYGMEDRYFVSGRGYNSRLDEVQAEILRGKLRRIEEYIRRRRELAARYDRLLAGSELVIPKEAPGNRHVYYLYVVRHPKRDAIVDALRARGIVLNVSYPWPIHTMTGFAHLGYKRGDFPSAEAAAGEVFSLPMYPTLASAQQEYVCASLLEVIAGLRAGA